MHNLLVVDDELIIARGIADDIDWTKAGVREVFVAEDGREACAVMEGHRIDIVLTDIRMPNVDGTELAREIKKRWPFAKVVFISGYDDFEYAQQAIDSAVFRYLMKPVGDDELLECVRAAGAAIDDEIANTARLSELENRVSEFLPHVRSRFLQLWIEGKREDALNRPSVLEQYEMRELPSSTAFIAIVTRDSWVLEGSRRETAYEMTVGEMCRKTLFRGEPAPAFWNEADDLVFVAYSPDSATVLDIREYVIRMAEAFQRAARRSLAAIVTVVVGPVVPAESIPASYRTIYDHFRENNLASSGSVVDIDRLHPSAPSYAIDTLARPVGIGQLVDTLQEDAAIAFIDETFREVERIGNVSNDTLLVIYCRVVDALIHASITRGIPVGEWIDDPHRRRYGFERFRSADELRNWSVRNIRLFNRRARSCDERNTSRIVQRTKRIVLENLTDDITVPAIARRLELNPNYLSTVFSRSEGATISDFIIAARVEAACRLLRSPGIKVYEVAEKVGYQSVAHFNRIFKNRVGMSPKKYQLSG